MKSQQSKKNARLRQRRKRHLEDVLKNIIHTPFENFPTTYHPQIKAYHEVVKAFENTGIKELFFGHMYEIERLIAKIRYFDSKIQSLEDQQKMLVSQLDRALREHELKYTQAEATEMRLTEMIKAIPILFRFTKPGKKPEYEPHRDLRMNRPGFAGDSIS